MEYTSDKLSLKEGLTKEWIITNGIGGYASSTIIGANTRRYHGLLIASLTPPARRHVILSKLDEAIKIEDKTYNLYTNVCKNYISDGYKNQISFEKDIIPTFKYKVGDVEIEKQVCMIYGENTVCILYKIKNGKKAAKLTLAPIMNYRDFHTLNSNHEFKMNQDVENLKVRVTIDNNKTSPVYINLSEGIYIKHENDIFKNMFYVEEEKRGFFPEEDHIVAGRYEVDILPKEEKKVWFVCSLKENIEEINVEDVIKKEIKRVEKIVKDTKLIKKSSKEEKPDKNKEEKNVLLKTLIQATDNFIVYRESTRLYTVIAGYHWFLDWGRDSLIAFEGLFLTTKRYDLAKEVLHTFTKDIKFGLVPNGYSGYDNRPLYNSVDSSLLLFEQIIKYLKYTKDFVYIKDNFYEILKNIIHSYKSGIDLDDNNIYLDNDGLLVSGTSMTQNTWMDAKIGGLVVTPRNGKAVEINAMWYNALKILEFLAEKYSDNSTKEEASKLADKCKKQFVKKFYNKDKKCLYDVIGDDKISEATLRSASKLVDKGEDMGRAAIRPNQLFSIGLTYPVLEPSSKQAKEVFDTVTKKLLNKYGLKTLAKGEKGYIDEYSRRWV